MNARKMASASLIVVLVTGATFAGEPTPAQWGAVLNLSGRQRMLTQKMTKEVLLVAAGIDAGKNRKALKETMSLFETTLAGLRDGSADQNLPATENKRIVKQLDKVKGLFEEIKPIFDATATGGTPSKDDLTTLEGKNVPLLKEMNKVVKMYERSAKGTLTGSESLAVVINLAGKQRMLTQKMSKEFLFVHLGVNTDSNRLNVRETSSLFDRTLKGLLEGDTDLDLPGTKKPQIRKQLEAVQNLWKGFYPIISKATDAELSESDVQEVANRNVPLLKNMNKAVKMFEGLAKGA